MTDANAPHAPAGLLRVLGLAFGLAVVVGGVIGSGIMRAPGLVAQSFTTTPLILLVWAAGGLVAIVTAMPLVEAGSAVPYAGGPYPIAQRAFGPLAGFITGWMGWLTYASATAFISSVFGEYVHRLGLLQGVSTHVLACALVLAVSALNWIGTRVSGASQATTSAIKGAVFIILIVILFASPRAPASLAPPVAHVASFGAAIMAVRLIYQTYAGWDAAIYFSEEVRSPGRNVARSTFWGIGLCTVVYVLVNAAVLHVLTPAQVAGSTLAVGDAAKVSLGGMADTLITGFGLFSLAAIVNLQTMAAPRITFRMARNGALPPVLGRVARGGTPRHSLALLTSASLLFAATGDYQSIVRIYAPWTIGVILMVCASQIHLRISEPDMPRPWKAPLFPWISILATLVQASLLVVVVVDDPWEGLLSAAVVAAPVPVYLMLTRRWRDQAVRAFGPASP